MPKKLGIKVESSVGTLGAPRGFAKMLRPLPPGVTITEEPVEVADVLIVFAKTHADLVSRFGRAIDLLPAGGGLWAAWPKKTAALETELSFEAVQAHGLAAGLVDNKVCAIDATWSGLRFVVRKEARSGWQR